jgi:hypothetical protein
VPRRLVTWASLRQVVHAPGGDGALRRWHEIVRCLLSGRRHLDAETRVKFRAVVIVAMRFGYRERHLPSYQKFCIQCVQEGRPVVSCTN